jgi:hypothetical protein
LTVGKTDVGCRCVGLGAAIDELDIVDSFFSFWPNKPSNRRIPFKPFSEKAVLPRTKRNVFGAAAI